MTTQIQTIQFNHQSLVTFEQNGTHYTAMKPICENIGLCWDGQRQRIQRDEVLSEGAVIITVPSNGGDQQMICLPIEYINGWLFGIDIKRCKPEIRETLIMYKKECYQALYNYWNKPQQLALPMVNNDFKQAMIKILNYASQYEVFQRAICTKRGEAQQRQMEFFFSEIADEESYLFIFKPNIAQDIQQASDLLHKLITQ